MRQVIPVSTQDVIEGQIALNRFPELPERLLLRTALVHRPQDFPVFELVWQAVMEENTAPQPAPETPAILSSEPERGPGHGGLGTGRGTGGVSLTGGGTQSSVKQPTSQDVTHALTQFDFSQFDSVNLEDTLKQLLGQIDLYAWLNTRELAYNRGDITVDAWEEAKRKAGQIENLLRKEFLIRSLKESNNWEGLKRQYWKSKPLFSLTVDERQMVQTAIKQWGHKLAIHPGFRRRPARRGILDFQACIRQACQNDGLAFRLHYRQKTPQVPDLIVLCDISNSVAPFAEFLLFLVARLRQHFRKVNLYFFIDTLWDVTGKIWDEDLEDLAEEIESWTRKSSSGYSDYGMVFREFAENNLQEVSAKSTVLILGDARNNYRPPQAEYLAQIREHVRNVLWLNPLREEEWHERDNALHIYQNYCSQVYRCRTVEDLFLIARRLIR